MSYRVAAGVLTHLLPVAAGTSPETFRGHTLKLGEELRDAAAVRPAAAAPASAVAISLDSTFIRSCHDGERHLEVRVGNVETAEGGRQVFGAVARSGTDVTALIRRAAENRPTVPSGTCTRSWHAAAMSPCRTNDTRSVSSSMRSRLRRRPERLIIGATILRVWEC